MKVSKPFLNIIPPKLFLLRWFVSWCNFCVILYIKIRRIKISTFLNTCSESPENHSSRNLCRRKPLCNYKKFNVLFRKPLVQAVTEMRMNSWGLYTVETQAVVHDDDVASPWEEFVCTLSLPPANYTANRTTIYYPGIV